MILAYVMRMDMRDAGTRDQLDYQDTLFAHAFISQNPDLFEKLYPEVFGLDEKNLDPDFWETDPESFEDFMREWQAEGR